MTLALLFVAFLAGGFLVAAGDQATAVAATPENAATFLGDWTLDATGSFGPATFALTLKVAEGKVVGEISSAAATKQAITNVSKDGTSVLLRYVLDYQGMPVNVVIRLTPGDGKVAADLDFAVPGRGQGLIVGVMLPGTAQAVAASPAGGRRRCRPTVSASSSEPAPPPSSPFSHGPPALQATSGPQLPSRQAPHPASRRAVPERESTRAQPPGAASWSRVAILRHAAPARVAHHPNIEPARLDG